jgi:hypothetical protein
MSVCWGKVVYNVVKLVIVDVYVWTAGVTVVPGVIMIVNGLVNVRVLKRLLVCTAPFGEGDVRCVKQSCCVFAAVAT